MVDFKMPPFFPRLGATFVLRNGLLGVLYYTWVG